jgi:hypothetical protein
MKTKSESPKVILFNMATLIFSAFWGFNPGSEAGAIRKRPDLSSLYAAYVSLFAR